MLLLAGADRLAGGAAASYSPATQDLDSSRQQCGGSNVQGSATANRTAPAHGTPRGRGGTLETNRTAGEPASACWINAARCFPSLNSRAMTGSSGQTRTDAERRSSARQIDELRQSGKPSTSGCRVLQGTHEQLGLEHSTLKIPWSTAQQHFTEQQQCSSEQTPTKLTMEFEHWQARSLEAKGARLSHSRASSRWKQPAQTLRDRSTSPCHTGRWKYSPTKDNPQQATLASGAESSQGAESADHSGGAYLSTRLWGVACAAEENTQHWGELISGECAGASGLDRWHGFQTRSQQ